MPRARRRTPRPLRSGWGPGRAGRLASGPGAPTPDSLAQLLGGRAAALDATAPAVGFVLGWLVSGRSVGWGVGAAVVTAAAVTVLRVRRGDRPRAALLGLLGVLVAGALAMATGRPEDFFVVQLLGNAASAIVWVLSILVRWPLLGVVVGAVLRAPRRWRGDPWLLRAYGRGSWVWAASYLVRVAVFLPLWWWGQVLALGVARVVLSWPLVVTVLGVSWWVVRRSLPPGHPGLRHPQVPGSEDRGG